MYRVAYRIAISDRRRRLAHRRALLRSGPGSEVPQPGPDAVWVATALAQLPPGQRAAIVLHYYDDLDVQQIARTLGLTPSGRHERPRDPQRPVLEHAGADPVRDAAARGHRDGAVQVRPAASDTDQPLMILQSVSYR